MTWTPPPGGALGWRIDAKSHAAAWDSGIGAEKFGGRWNRAGTKAVYAALDPSTAILEVAVHKGFRVLDTTAHVITSFRIKDAADVFVVTAADVPNPAWLHPGTPGAGQQAFGDSLLEAHKFVAIPSAVSRHAWNLIFHPERAAGAYTLERQEAFALDPRLNPPVR